MASMSRTANAAAKVRGISLLRPKSTRRSVREEDHPAGLGCRAVARRFVAGLPSRPENRRSDRVDRQDAFSNCAKDRPIWMGPEDPGCLGLVRSAARVPKNPKQKRKTALVRTAKLRDVRREKEQPAKRRLCRHRDPASCQRSDRHRQLLMPLAGIRCTGQRACPSKALYAQESGRIRSGRFAGALKEVPSTHSANIIPFLFSMSRAIARPPNTDLGPTPPSQNSANGREFITFFANSGYAYSDTSNTERWGQYVLCLPATT